MISHYYYTESDMREERCRKTWEKMRARQKYSEFRSNTFITSKKAWTKKQILDLME